MAKNSTRNTPEHCHDCWKLADCNQAQFMNANTEPVEGYAYDADTYCQDCLPNGAVTTPLDNSETDSPAHCGGCGVPLHCQLTTDGVDYVKESIEDGAGCCQELWPVLFADYLS